MSPQNVLLIISDQQRTDTLGFLGKTPCRTPHLDALAAQGISFNRAMCTAPLCGPSRASIFTGKYAHQVPGVLLDDPTKARGPETVGSSTDMMTNFSSMKEPPLLTDRLKRAGYYTAYAGKWHLGEEIVDNWFDNAAGYAVSDYLAWCDERGISDGWPLQDPEVRSHKEPPMSIPVTKVQKVAPEETNDAWIADIAIRQIKERPKDRPFFVSCGFNGPHPPFKIPEPYFSMYDPSEIPEPENFRPGPGEPEYKKRSFYRALWKDHGEDWEKWKKAVAVYWGFATLIDDQVGRLVAALEDEGVRDNTVVIFCSDHGEMLGQHGLWHKMQPYEESIRVPLIISPPDAYGGEGAVTVSAANQSVAEASLLDIPATILSYAGVEIPEGYEGVDLSPFVAAMETGGSRESPVKAREYLFCEHKPLGDFHNEVDWRMVTDNRLKYVWNRGETDELYDLEADPAEMCNLIDHTTYYQAITKLQDALRAWMEKTGDPLAAELRG